MLHDAKYNTKIAVGLTFEVKQEQAAVMSL
jgi:hypothetical protein